MGSRQTKIEGEYLPGTPAVEHVALQGINRAERTTQASNDPRSPSGLRTPISLPSQRVCTTGQLVPVDVDENRAGSEKPFEVLRKRFLKGFTNQDPRSPSLNFNRTPLVFEDSHDRTLDLDDTFADLFVESNGSDPLVEDALLQGDTEMPECSMPTKENEMKTESPITPQQQFDPRSPSIGVDRTPIILCDDDNDDINEDAFLENILATLTLNLDGSANSSFVSLKSSNGVDATGTEENNVNQKPTNKHLDRVRVAKKTISKGPHRRQKRALRQKIYEDRENQQPLSPQVKSKMDNINTPMGNRTPLSCVRNRSQLRSRSVESSARSVKAHFSVKSFDDSLNPSENKKVANIHIMCDGSQDSLKL